MSKTVEFFFDVGSPSSYLAWTQLPGIAAGAQAQIVWRPMLLGGVFKATGNQSPVAIPSKGRYVLQDFARFAKRYGVPMAFNPYFPINTLALMRGAAGYLDSDAFQPYLRAVFEAIWVRQQNLGKPEIVAEVLSAAGLDIEEAVKRGVFGAPTFFVGDEMHFGQDRLDFVAEALARAD